MTLRPCKGCKHFRPGTAFGDLCTYGLSVDNTLVERLNPGTGEVERVRLYPVGVWYGQIPKAWEMRQATFPTSDLFWPMGVGRRPDTPCGPDAVYWTPNRRVRFWRWLTRKGGPSDA